MAAYPSEHKILVKVTPMSGIYLTKYNLMFFTFVDV